MRTLPLIAAVLFVAMCLRPCEASETITCFYVDDDAPVAGADGQTWQTAFPYLQDALAAAAPFAGTPVEIRVAQGTYKPDQGAGVVAGDRNATFYLTQEISILGGFQGFSSPSQPELHDPAQYITTLDGDLLSNDSPVPSSTNDNSIHIFLVDAPEIAISISGMCLKSGNASLISIPMDVSVHEIRGGGIHVVDANLSLKDLMISGCKSDRLGGAIFATDGELLIDRCIFMDNRSLGDGGAIYSSAVFVAANSRFLNNGALGLSPISGGAVWARYVNKPPINIRPIVMNCEFIGNYTYTSAVGGSGGAANLGLGDVVNSVFYKNRSNRGGALSGPELSVSNSIFWANEGGDGPSEIQITNNQPVYFGRNIIDGYETGYAGSVGLANTPPPDCCGEVITIDPGFSDPDGPDGVPGTLDDNLQLVQGSPGIDAGINADIVIDTDDTDSDGNTTEPFPLDILSNSRRADVVSAADTGSGQGPLVDLGPYEITACMDCPGDRFWQAPVDGQFSMPANWFPGTPGIGNTTVFDLDASYTITTDSNIETNDLRAEHGIVTLDLDGYAYNLGALDQTPLVVGSGASDDATLTFRDGLLLSEGATIGDDPGSVGSLTLTGIDGPFDWISQRSIVVGASGNGSLTIEDGALVVSSAGVLGQSTGSSGDVTVRNPGSDWTVPFGVQVQNGTLTIENEASVTADFFALGGVAVLSNGAITGDGDLFSSLLNFGTAHPTAAVGAVSFSPLNVSGDYQQVGLLPPFGQNQGTLELLVAGLPAMPDDAPLQIGGDAVLGGAVVVDFTDNTTLAPGERFPVLRASSLPEPEPDPDLKVQDNMFDVAYFQGFFDESQPDIFMSLEYIASARGNLMPGVDVVVNSLGASPSLGDPIGAGSVSAPPTAAAVGDLNSDGFDDLAVVIPGSLIIYVNAGATGGTWNGYTQLAPIAIGNNPTGVTIGDLDGDLFLDVVVVDGDDNEAAVYLDVADGSSTSADVTFLAGLLTAPTGVLLANFTGDGLDELIIIGEHPTEGPNADGVAVAFESDLPGGVFGGFLPAPNTARVGRNPVFLSSSDLDQDKDLDQDLLAVANAGGDSVSTLLNLGSDMGNWLGFGGRVDLNVGDQPVWLAIGDLDLDDNDDLFVVNALSDSASVILGAGGGAFEPASQIPVGSNPRSVALVNLDLDTGESDLDVAIVLTVADELDPMQTVDVIRILRNDLDSSTGQLAFSQNVDLLAGSAPRFVFGGELDNDGGDDLISVNDQSTLPLQQRGVPAPMDIQAVLTIIPATCAADVNGDGVVDTADLGILISQFGQSGPGASSDVNGDDIVDTADLGILIGEFGSICG